MEKNKIYLRKFLSMIYPPIKEIRKLLLQRQVKLLAKKEANT